VEERLKVILYEPSGRGGICHYTYQLAEALAELDTSVTLFTTESYELEHFKRHFHIYYHIKKSSLKSLLTYIRAYILGENTKQSKEIIYLGEPNRKDPKINSSMIVFQVLRRWYRRLKAICSFLYNRPHIIHFQWLVFPREDYYFIKILRLLRFKTIYTAHNLLPHDNDSDEIKKTLRKIYQSVNHIIVHAKQNREELTRQFGIDENKITIIHHGSYDLFSRESNFSKETVRRRLNLPNDKKIVLFFGAIRKYKGLDYLIEAVHKVRNQVCDAILLVVGRKTEDNGKNDEYYIELTKMLDDHDAVIFIERYIDVAEVGCYFSASDLVVLPYIKVYQSGVLMLAYASGKAVVVTDVGGLSEVVEASKTGFVVPPCDTSALADAIVKILVDPGQREAMERRAKHLAETTYSWRNIALRTRKLYRSIAETN
jgi:D-inositol-3-phosphate glycosyltransferase